MIPQQTFESYPVFGDNATKVQPDNAKYSAGFQQADVLPAEWMNWAWNKNTKGITDLNAAADSMEKELISVLTAAGQTPAQATNDQLLTSINYLITQAETRAKLAAHPIGSLYWSSDSTDPSTLFGGTWNRIKDTFIWAAGDSDTVNTTGGAKTVTLQEANLPSHKHSFTPAGTISGGAYKFTGSEVTSGAMSGNSTGSITFEGGIGWSTGTASGNMSKRYKSSAGPGGSVTQNMVDQISINVAHTHKVTAAGSISITTNPTFSGTAGNTGNTGSGTAVDKMPPYTVKYCWERTA